MSGCYDTGKEALGQEGERERRANTAVKNIREKIV